ncbi:MAG: hypothetical protein GY696_12700 [Gammaproteobacteria bacterium]|nr:hypothetical protein [Gammaproteobacteria bacterium]
MNFKETEECQPKSTKLCLPNGFLINRSLNLLYPLEIPEETAEQEVQQRGPDDVINSADGKPIEADSAEQPDDDGLVVPRARVRA